MIIVKLQYINTYICVYYIKIFVDIHASNNIMYLLHVIIKNDS